MSFNRALEVVLELEGQDRVTNDPKDSGGVTKWGISQRAFPSMNIRELTRDQASDIYLIHYWRRCRCDDFPYPVALCVFDMAVNCGVSAACKALQRAVNVAPDGVLGPQTLAAVKAIDAATVVERVMKQRITHYLHLNQVVFLHGWLNRCITVMAAALRSE